MATALYVHKVAVWARKNNLLNSGRDTGYFGSNIPVDKLAIAA
jgi:hypothetical protein